MFDASLNPDAAHAPACYWFWHSIPSPETISQQVREMHAAGFRSFLIQPRRSFPMVDYLSDEYLEAYRIAVDEAICQGMRVGIYDEYNWQSGHAGGRTVEHHLASRERHIFWSRTVSPGEFATLPVTNITSSTEYFGEPGMSWHYDDSVLRWEDWSVLAVVATDGEGRSLLLPNTNATVRQVASGVEIDIRGLTQGASVAVFIASTCATSRIPNLMEHDSVEAFIEVGYEPYKRTLAGYFGEPVDYLFFDQPHANFYTWDQLEGNLVSSIPMSREWWESLLSHHGHVLAQMLLALVEDTEHARILRPAFYQHHGEWSQEAFFGTIHAWCADNGLPLTGHEVLGHVGAWPLSGTFSDWDLRVNFGLDYFGVDSYRDITAVDAEGSDFQLSAKLGDSVARSNGRRGVILEQYFGDHPSGDEFSGHWGLTPEELRRAVLVNHLLGMRQMIFHAFYQTDGRDDDPSVLSNPRFDFAPGINFEPWFAEHHSDIAIESGRLSHFLDGAEPDFPVAVFYPLSELRAGGLNSPIGDRFGWWCERLFRAGVGYLIVPETATDEDLEHYEIVIRLAQTQARATSRRVTVIDDFDAQMGPRDDLLRAVVELSNPRLTHDRPMDSVVSWTGEDKNGARVAAFNTSKTESADLRVRLDGATRIVHHLLHSGRTAIEGAHGEHLSLTLAPGELVTLELHHGETVTDPPSLNRGIRKTRSLSSAWTLELDGCGAPKSIDVSQGWEAQGHPTFTGSGLYRTTFCLDRAEVRDVVLTLPSLASAARIELNGALIGRIAHAPYRLAIPGTALAEDGQNHLTVAVTNTAANRYYSGSAHHRDPETSGLSAPPALDYTCESDEGLQSC